MKYSKSDIRRFIEAQESPFCGYEVALQEVKSGRKRSHWIWYTFPQFRELGYSRRSDYWGIVDRQEAVDYLAHPLLGARLREITSALLAHDDKPIAEILGALDVAKLHSSMTMFDAISPNDIFGAVLTTFYSNERDEKTLEIMRRECSVC
ncbi:MAG: DUF1810 domain-containing protein [Alistipes sp.]|nr:DUF1810 domain-containing protein [Alistipes sp.]